MYITKKLPVGIESFAEMLSDDYYYVDKTEFIRELLQNRGKVNLFTRPRRFGKTLNMDMLKTFFSYGTDPALFQGLKISADVSLCEQYLGKCPVIFLSLKSVSGSTFSEAYDLLSEVIREEALRFQWLMDSDRLSIYEKLPLEKMLSGDFSRPLDLHRSLKVLSQLLYRHYGQRVIILIDEYDVPLEKAYQNDYYDSMVLLIRSLLDMALKTNDSLFFAVLTGCLRISRESIFTGLNNFSVHTSSDSAYDEFFGFTDKEVLDLLRTYNLSDCYNEVKEWYDGYRFGQENIYCPWDVINYVKDHISNHAAPALSYWANSSGNSIVKRLIEQASGTVKDQIEELISGGTVSLQPVQELTYPDLNTENDAQRTLYLWSVLYTTGYLTDRTVVTDTRHTLCIPNREIRQIFEQQIQTWFSEVTRSNLKELKMFWQAVASGNSSGFEQLFRGYLQTSISIRDTYVAKNKKENFYHGILLGLLSGEDSWIVKTNAESGNGYSDILIKIPFSQTGCIIEVKYAEQGAFDAACAEAMQQIQDRDYIAAFRQERIPTVYEYGVACYLKDCKVVSKTIQL